MSSFETEKIESPISTNFYWPTKKDLTKKMSFPTIDVYSNHYEVNFDKEQQFSEWHLRYIDKEDIEKFKETPTLVEDKVPADSRELISEIYGSNRKKLFEKLGSCFHTGNTLYSIGKTENLQGLFIFEEHSKYALVAELKNHRVDFSGLIPNEGCRKQLLRFLNSNLKKILFLKNYYEFGRLKKYYNMNMKATLPQHYIEIYRGFKTGFEHYEGGIKVLIDTSCRILRTQSLWKEFLNERIDSRDRELIKEFFIGKNCVASYGNNKRYRIDDVDFKLNVQSHFPDAHFKNYAEYYQEKYKQKIQYANQFLLIAKTKFVKYTKDHKREVIENEVHLLPELLQPTGLTDEMKSNFRIMKDVGRETIMFPEQRFGKIEGLAKEISEFKDTGFQMQIDIRSNKITGYKLRYPQIKTSSTFRPNNDKIRINDLYKSKTVKKWVFLYDFKSKRDVNTVLDNLAKCSKRYRVKFDMPSETIELPRNIRVKDLSDLISLKEPKLIFFFITKFTAKYFYNQVKRFYQKRGIVTQFFTSFNFRKDQRNLSKFSNLLLQMVVKLGGTLWNVRSEIKHSITSGVSINKVKKGPNNFEEMGCVVSQFGDNFRKQHSTADFKDSATETVNDCIARLLIEPCLYYKKKLKKDPKRLIIYRNCENERGLNNIIEKEINGLVDLLKKEFKNPPKLCVIIVTKRINDRFAVNSQRGLQNPEGVAIVDDVVKTGSFNFYLICQKVNQGTATPTHYQVIYNNTDLDSEQIITHTYDMSYNYMNWMGPVRIPSSLQYSEKMGAQLILTQQNKISKNLKKKFFYL